MTNPFEPNLSALHKVNEMNSLRAAAGMNRSATELLKESYEKATGMGVLEQLRRHQIEGIAGMKQELLKISNGFSAVHRHEQELKKIYAGDIFNELGKLQAHRRAMEEALGPLSALRSATLFESELDRIKKHAGGSLNLVGKLNTEAFSATEHLRKQHEHLFSNVGETVARNWMNSVQKLATQFEGVNGLKKHLDLWNRAYDFGPARMARELGIPLMDPASLGTIANLSGTAGILDHLKNLGVDAALLRSFASIVTDEDEEIEELVSEYEKENSQAPSKLTLAQLMFLLNLIFVLYQVFFPMYQQWDSNQAEARIIGEVRASEERTKERFEAAVEKLLEGAVKAVERADLNTHSLVVKRRMALIRSSPRSGAGVVAEAFPNQVVTLLEERGKWVRISYQDLIAHEEREGWALKKYFARLERGEREPSLAQRIRSVDDER